MIFTSVEIVKMPEYNAYKIPDYYNYFEIVVESVDEKGRKSEYRTPLLRTFCLEITEAIENGVIMTQDSVKAAEERREALDSEKKK